MARVLVTGGCGYVGSVLVPKIIASGHDVEVVDLCWFGPITGVPLHRMDFTEAPLEGFDAIIHLAGIANDPTGELDPKLTWETNALGTMRLADKAVRAGVKQFIYASSGSVYGVCETEVTEDSPLVPISEYNKTKMVAERVLLSYHWAMNVQILRPATVCGYSPRMRLDTMVNSFTIQALTKGVISYNGGEQYRPNIHIDDMTDLYLWMLERPNRTGIFNAGFENLKIKEIAGMVGDIVGAKITSQQSNDPRSYRINSDELLRLGFKPKKRVIDAIDELVIKYRDGKLKDTDECYNIRQMRKAA